MFGVSRVRRFGQREEENRLKVEEIGWMVRQEKDEDKEGSTL